MALTETCEGATGANTIAAGGSREEEGAEEEEEEEEEEEDDGSKEAALTADDAVDDGSSATRGATDIAIVRPTGHRMWESEANATPRRTRSSAPHASSVAVGSAEDIASRYCLNPRFVRVYTIFFLYAD
jgi:hypothetical protein